MNIHSGVEIGNLYNNKVCSMGVAAFVGLILAFVIAIVACAYYYFLDEEDEEEYEEDEDEDEDYDEDDEDEEYDDEEDEEDDLPTYSKKGKILHSLNLSKYFFLNQFCPYLFLSRFLFFSLIFSEFGQSALTV